MRPEWHAHKFQWAVSLHPARPSSWFHHKSHFVGRDLPWSVISKAPMRKRALGPAGVDEVERTILVAHVDAGCLNYPTIKTSKQSSLFALRFQEVVDCAHEVRLALLIVSGKLLHLQEFVTVDFGEEAISKSIRFLLLACSLKSTG